MYNAANNASSQLAQAISAADTSLTVLDGSSFPDVPFLVTIEDEIIEVGAKDGNTFLALVRGTEGTTPASHASGSRVENRFTAGTYQQIVDKINNLKAEEIEYTSEVTSFTPTQVAAALDALAGVRIVEMGSNANGEYVRWENGLQVCTMQHRFEYDGSSLYTSNEVYSPAPFLGEPWSITHSTQIYSLSAHSSMPCYSTIRGWNTDHNRIYDLIVQLKETSSSHSWIAVHVLVLGRWK